MPRKPQDVTEAELAVLRVLWKSGPTTIREITEVVYPDDPKTQYSTVKRLLARMRSKGIVDSDTSGFAHVFRAEIARDELVGRRLQQLAGELCEGSSAPLLMQLLKSEEYTREERKELHEMFEELVQSKNSRKR